MPRHKGGIPESTINAGPIIREAVTMANTILLPVMSWRPIIAARTRYSDFIFIRACFTMLRSTPTSHGSSLARMSISEAAPDMRTTLLAFPLLELLFQIFHTLFKLVVLRPCVEP